MARMSETLGRLPAAAGLAGGDWSGAAAGVSATGAATSGVAPSGDEAASEPFPSAARAAARISATDIFLLFDIECLTGQCGLSDRPAQDEASPAEFLCFDRHSASS